MVMREWEAGKSKRLIVMVNIRCKSTDSKELKPCAGKLAHTVLRRGSDRNIAFLSD
jgi:hypothetical protein